mgnify:CR=1 FL=1|jgi:hypothetical protein
MDLFNIVDLAGKLLNKKEPDDDDETPYNEFLKWEHIDIMEVEGEEDIEIQYVKAEDVPKILLAIFIGRPDEKRTDAAELLEKY